VLLSVAYVFYCDNISFAHKKCEADYGSAREAKITKEVGTGFPGQSPLERRYQP